DRLAQNPPQNDSDKLSELINDIAREHNACQEACKNAVQHAVAAGKLLVAAKELVKHGEWGQWLKANTKISQRQASTYMAIAKRWESIPNSQRASIFSIREAMKLIAQAVDADEQSPSAAPK